jgi:hypothetical protein
MPNEDEKKSNKNKGLDPSRMDIGPLGKANAFVDNFAAGWIYATAIEELLEQQKRVEDMLASIEEADDDASLVLRPLLEKELQEIEDKWLLAAHMFGLEA